MFLLIFILNKILLIKKKHTHIYIYIFSGGTKGFIISPGVVSRYYVTAAYRHTCLTQVRRMTDVTINRVTHHDLISCRIMEDETTNETLVNLMRKNFPSQFGREQLELVNFSNGATALPDVCHDLIGGQKKGETAYQRFQEKQAKKIPLPKINRKTFDKKKRSITKHASCKEIVLLCD